MRRYQMPLSEYEQRVLEQMERQLSSDDPKLVHALQGAPTGMRRWLLTGAGALAGLSVLVVGAATGNPLVGVLGFVAMFVSVVLAFSPPRRRERQDDRDEHRNEDQRTHQRVASSGH